ncbi:MAG: transcriptional regulator, partial [Microlunatus sp.]|nr:transcriptional regulator [Microlunatus sp.]
MSQPTVSHRMRLLADPGLVSRDQCGKWAYYFFVDKSLQAPRGSRTLAAR